MALDPYRRSSRALAATFLAYALLVGFNLGEFWPFSIYPMFSQGGIPWSRAVVREVPTDEPSAVSWQAYEANELPGRASSLFDYNVDPSDLSNFVSKTRIWNEARVRALRGMFREAGLDQKSLLVMRVNGRITEDDSVRISFIPYALLTADSTQLNANLPRTHGE